MNSEPNDEYFNRLVNTDALRNYLESHIGPVTDYTVSRHQAGHSNETLFVTWDDETYVLRRPPPGDTAEGAHDVIREYHIIDALQDSEVRVPPTVLKCEDPSVIGSDFYLMEYVPGDVIRTTEPNRFQTPSFRERVGTELIDGLSEINTVDYETIGLGDLGHPAQYLDRQVSIWNRQFDWAFEVTTNERTIPRIQTIGAWLTDNTPHQESPALVHGDYKLDNVLFEPGVPPSLTSIFDWELSTIGDPRADLGYLLVFWRDPHDPDPILSELIPTFTEKPGYPTRHDLVNRWETNTGLEFTHDQFYRTLGAFKLTAFCEMFYRRYLEGNADNELYPKMKTAVPRLAEQTHNIMNGNYPL